MTTNFNEIALLNNLPIRFSLDENSTFIFLMPTLTDIYGGTTGFFITFCSVTIGEFKKKFPQFIVGNSKIDFILQLMQFKKPKNYIQDFLNSFNKFIPNVEIVDDCLEQNGNILTDQVFDVFCDYLQIATAKKKLNKDNSKKEELTEFEKKVRANKEKIAKIRNNNKSGGVKLDVVLAYIAREFHCSFHEIYNMNLYTIYYLYSLSGRLMRYSIDVGLAGNNLLKKDTKLEHYTSSVREEK